MIINFNNNNSNNNNNNNNSLDFGNVELFTSIKSVFTISAVYKYVKNKDK